MERVTADELREAAEQCDEEGIVYHKGGYAHVTTFLLRAAETIDEMDKDIAVFESEKEGDC